MIQTFGWPSFEAFWILCQKSITILFPSYVNISQGIIPIDTILINVRIVAKSDVNLMTSQNLAVVFSPTIMRDKDGSRQIVDMQSTCACTKFLIDHANTLFSTHKSSLSIDRSLEANAIPARIRDRI